MGDSSVYPPVEKTQQLDPFLSQLANADNSYIMDSNGVCQSCKQSIQGKTQCPYCGDLQ